MAQKEKIEFLKSYGWLIGDRDPRLNTDYAGAFMVCEPFDDSEVPTRDGSNGPWCVVGDDLDALIDTAHETLASMVA
jgi:hypothetical protein